MRKPLLIAAVTALAAAFVQCVGADPVTGSAVEGPDSSQGDVVAPGLDAAGDTSGSDGSDAADGSLPPLTTTPQVAVGYGFSCALRASGKVYCWGDNASGQLGRQSTTPATTPTPGPVSQIINVARIAAGVNFVCALLTDHTVWCWGSNFVDQLGHPVAQDAPNTYRATPSQVAGLTDVDELAVGASHVCVRKHDKSVFCWGANYSNQLGYDNAGDVICGTQACNPTPKKVAGVTADQIAVGLGHSCARVGTTAICWGSNESAQLGHAGGQNGDVMTGGFFSNPTPTAASATGISALFASANDTCMLDGTQSVSCWGSDSSGQLGDTLTNAVSSVPVKIAGLPGNASKTSSGYVSSCALFPGLNGVHCWGSSDNGQLGTSGLANPAASTTVPALTGVTDLSSSPIGQHRCALLDTGEVRCWGTNASGELGHVNTADPACTSGKCNPTPTAVASLPP